MTNKNNDANLSFGIFWIISDDLDFNDYKLLCFRAFCDAYGNPMKLPEIPLNSKSGTSYNHKIMWDSRIKNNPANKPYNKKSYNYYPRGRVEIANNTAIIYLSPLINQSQLIARIKSEFGLSSENISSMRIIADNSAHYECLQGREAMF